MSDIVERLSTGTHAVEVSLRPERSAQALKECLDRQFVHIRFTETRGGTELGVPVDAERSNLSGADFAQGVGVITIVGEISLDFVDVRCVAEIDLQSLQGRGHLVKLPAA